MKCTSHTKAPQSLCFQFGLPIGFSSILHRITLKCMFCIQLTLLRIDMLGGTWTQADCQVGTGRKQVRALHLTNRHIQSLSDAMFVLLNTSHQAVSHSGRGIWALNYPCSCIVKNHPSWPTPHQPIFVNDIPRLINTTTVPMLRTVEVLILDFLLNINSN